MKGFQLTIIIGLAVMLFFSCKKETFITSPNARLNLSTDSIKFDTVFTTVGSITQSFKIFNDNDQQLLISKIKLMGGATSNYKININGLAASEANNIEVAAKDSIYVFVTVNVDPSSANLPFIISDSILINYNSNNRFVQLQAYGQNAHFLNNMVIANNTTWINDLPYIIVGSLQVDTGISLTINKGCRIYSHATAPFIVDGTLITNGLKDEEVQFTGDRLDEPYKNFPGSWPGIYFRGESKDNELNFTNIKNAYQAVVVQGPSVNTNPKLNLQQCIIDNAADAGLLSINSSIEANNSLITNCGKNISITLGGNYIFTNCTVAAYSNSFLLHKVPVLSVANSAEINGSIATADLNANFLNCIFWGDNGTVDDEVIINKEGSTLFNVLFDHTLYKASIEPTNITFNSALRNIDPVFDSIDLSNNYYDFRISKDPFAPGIDQGAATGFLTDLDNNNRSVGLPDLGSYEKQ